MGQMISFQNLSVAPYEVEKLLDVKMEHKMNQIRRKWQVIGQEVKAN